MISSLRDRRGSVSTFRNNETMDVARVV
jgi:hypothetical protein